MYSFDEAFYQNGFKAVAGIDEAGRGPLAGPVYAAAVILDNQNHIEGLRDSKKLTPKKRELLFPIIKEQAVAYSIAWATEEEIDEINILEATLLAMRRAVDGLKIKPDHLLIDGNTGILTDIETDLVVKGDSKSASIAAASILAKVARDHKIIELSEIYPQYSFEKHKGYPTKLHYEMLDEYGPCPIHRRTFLRKWEKKKNEGK